MCLVKHDVFYVCSLNSDCLYPLVLIMAVGHRLSDYSRKVIVAGEGWIGDESDAGAILCLK